MKSKWILLVEDNSRDADLAKRAIALGESRAEVILARDGVEAMECLQHQGKFQRVKGNPLVVLLDLKMPRMDGFEVLEEIKDDPELQCVPVVVFTSSQQEYDIDRCYRLGANAYVAKPMDFRKYVAALKEVMWFWTTANVTPAGLAAREHASTLRRQPQWV